MTIIYACLLLSGCGTWDAYRARTQLVGVTEPDALACLGVPDHWQYVSPGQHVGTWIYTQTGDDVDLGAGVYTLKLGRPGICHTSLRFVGGYVRQVGFQDVDVSPTNPDSICGRMVAECLHHRQSNPLPADFNPDAVLAPAPVTIKRGVTGTSGDPSQAASSSGP